MKSPSVFGVTLTEVPPAPLAPMYEPGPRKITIHRYLHPIAVIVTRDPTGPAPGHTFIAPYCPSFSAHAWPPTVAAVELVAIATLDAEAFLSAPGGGAVAGGDTVVAGKAS